jgi:hypothetical protein
VRIEGSRSSQDMRQDGERVDSRSFANAMLNILEDSAAEKDRLADMRRAVLNILEDSEDEKT